MYLPISLLNQMSHQPERPLDIKRMLKLYKIKSNRTILKTSHVGKINVIMATSKLFFFLLYLLAYKLESLSQIGRYFNFQTNDIKFSQESPQRRLVFLDGKFRRRIRRQNMNYNFQNNNRIQVQFLSMQCRTKTKRGHSFMEINPRKSEA